MKGNLNTFIVSFISVSDIQSNQSDFLLFLSVYFIYEVYTLSSSMIL